MIDDGSPEIPDILATAWGVQDRPSKGPKRGLSVDVIVGAAMRVAATDGLAAVTMSRVASELDTAAMSLYRYVGGKEELLVLMMEGASGQPPDDVWTPPDNWRAGVGRWARALRTVYLANPWVLEIPISSPPVTPNHVAWMECGLRAMPDVLDQADKVSTLLLLLGWVRSDTALQAGITADASDAADANVAFSGTYGAILSRVADERRFPAVRAAVDADVFGQDEGDDGSYDFEFGLARILDGIALFMSVDRTDDADRPG